MRCLSARPQAAALLSLPSGVAWSEVPGVWRCAESHAGDDACRFAGQDEVPQPANVMQSSCGDAAGALEPGAEPAGCRTEAPRLVPATKTLS